MRSERVFVEYRRTRIGISTIVRRSGGHLIALLHGFGCAKECFSRIFENDVLSDFSILAFDFPGHGESDKLCDRSMYSLEAFADMTNIVIDLFAPERVSFVGHSMGGAVSLIASRLRSDIYGIIDADGNLVSQDCGIVSRATAAQTLGTFQKVGFKNFLDRLRSSCAADELMWASWYAEADPVALYQSARSLVEWSDSGELLEIFKSQRQKKVIYVYGDKDSKDYLLPELRGIGVHAIEGSGHFMMLDNPAAFSQVVADFFTGELVGRRAE